MTAPAIDALSPAGRAGTAARRVAARPHTAAAPAATARYRLSVTVDPVEVRAAQRLRHRVFAGEMGALLPSFSTGLDVDGFDRHCDHLIVWDDVTGDAVGTYRILPPGRRSRLYSDSEFDLTRLAELRPELVEVGRSCVHTEHRNGAVIGLMWTGLARYMYLSGLRWLAGCASVPIRDAAGVWRRVADTHLAPQEYRVRPHRPLLDDALPAGTVALPPLLRGYLRLGAWVCGAPALDVDFGVGDLFVLLNLDRSDPRYLRHFLGGW